MGKQQSKEEKEEQEKVKINDKRMIYIDEIGNFVIGDKLFDPDEEAIQIMKTDDPIEEEGKEWYIINTAWMNAWLMYCRLNKNVNPNPGPCRNECLLVPNEKNICWVARPDLVMARKDKEGDYRRISRATWEKFCELYPGSGPAIRVIFHEDEEHIADGLYDTSGWLIEQSQFTPSKVPVYRKPFLGLGSKNNKTTTDNQNNGGAEETKGNEDPMGSSASGQMDDSNNNLNTETSQTSFKQFFGTTGNPILASGSGYQPTNRNSSGSAKEKEATMSETERALFED